MAEDVVYPLAFATGSAVLVTVLLQRRRYWFAACCAALGMAWLVTAPRLLEWIAHLGSDSFSEAQAFDIVEAFDFINSLRQILAPALAWRNIAAVSVLFLVALGLTAALSHTRPGATVLRSRWISAAAIVLLTGIPLLQLLPAFGEFRWNSEYYRVIFSNFHGPHTADIQLVGDVRDLNVLVYIGESTSALNMGIYGYPRATTPQLDEFRRQNPETFFLFKEVFSTHVHTAPSLLEALSVGVDRSGDELPISHRRRISLVDVLARADISSTLISNQGRAGAWNNLASTVVFRNVGDKEFSFNSRWFGELEHRARRPLDHEFLPAALERSRRLDTPGPEVVFLHSYAGHGPYLRNISGEFQSPVDDMFAQLAGDAVAESGSANPDHVLQLIEQYDSTIRYIDHALAVVMRRATASSFPTAVVYFADHGDAVYAGLRHDSSRFRHEMARIPFLVFFNDAAASKYPELLQQTRDASLSQKTSTLAQLPSTLLGLFGLRIDDDRFRGLGIDDPGDLPPILTRESGHGFTYVRLAEQSAATSASSQAKDAADAHTRLYRTVRSQRGRAPRICADRARTVGDILRGVLVTDCIRVELTATDPHPGMTELLPGLQNGLGLSVVAAVAGSYDREIWASGAMLVSAADCRTFEASWTVDPELRSRLQLLSIPAHADWRTQDFRNCIGTLRSTGLRIGIELPSDIVGPCSAELPVRSRGLSCHALSNFLDEVATSDLVSDLVVENGAADAINRLPVDHRRALNARGVSMEAIAMTDMSSFHAVSVDPAGGVTGY